MNSTISESLEDPASTDRFPGIHPKTGIAPGSDLRQLHKAFFDQSDEHLLQMEHSILRLNVWEGDPGLLNTVCKSAHSIKEGAAAFDCFPRLALTAHMLGDAIEEVTDGHIVLSDEFIRLFLDAKDVLKAQLDRYRHDLDQDDTAFRRICSELRSISDLNPGVHGATSKNQRCTVDPHETACFSTSDVTAAVSATTSVPVAMHKLGQLEELSGKLVDAQVILTRASAALDPVQHQCFLRSLDKLVCHTRTLQHAIRSIRMVSFVGLFHRCSRLAHDLAIGLDKQVEVRTSGESIELDRQVVQALCDPLTDLVRNSLIHGIESASVRVAAGKPPAGRLMLSLQRFTHEAIIEVSDDGAGLSRDRIIKNAHALGHVVRDDASDEVVWSLLFKPGFPKTCAIGRDSARGEGLDGVQQKILALGGKVNVQSCPGHGTTMRVSLPLTHTPGQA